MLVRGGASPFAAATVAERLSRERFRRHPGGQSSVVPKLPGVGSAAAIHPSRWRVTLRQTDSPPVGTARHVGRQSGKRQCRGKRSTDLCRIGRQRPAHEGRNACDAVAAKRRGHATRSVPRFPASRADSRPRDRRRKTQRSGLAPSVSVRGSRRARESVCAGAGVRGSRC